MSLEKAIQAAMEIEATIRDLYRKALETCNDPVGRRFFSMLEEDEQYHHDYLADRLNEFRKTGAVQYPDIEAKVPSADDIKACVDGANKTMAVEDRGVLQQMLSNALQVETRTSEFYSQMVAESDGDPRDMFKRFLEIEDAHIAAVQAELDYVMNTGYWFDIKEFDME